MVRYKNRYIVVEINQRVDSQTSQLKDASLYESIISQIQRLYGDFGAAAIRAGFIAKYVNKQTGVAIIRSRRGPHRFVSSVIPLIKKIDDKQCVVNILYVGATIRKSFFFVRNYQQRKFDEYCIGLKTDEEKNKLKEVMLNFEHIRTNMVG